MPVQRERKPRDKRYLQVYERNYDPRLDIVGRLATYSIMGCVLVALTGVVGVGWYVMLHVLHLV